MGQSVSFSNLRAIVAAAAGQEKRTFVGTVDGDICVSVNFNYESPHMPPVPKSKKRGRDDSDDAVETAVQRVKRGLRATDECSDDMLAASHAALYAILTRLRGANGEQAVESWGLSYKQAEKNGHESGSNGNMRPRLILSARLTPGVAVPMSSLFQCLGASCSGDGMLTTQHSDSLAPGFNLPLSEQARAAESHGQKAVTLFATVSAN